MAKRESTFINMFLTLLIVSSVAALALGGVYMATKGPIEENQRRVMENALQEVLPDFDNDITSDMVKVGLSPGDTITFYFARQGDDTVGVAVQTFSKQGYSGLIRVMVGMTPDGTIMNTSVLGHAETPGLGDKIEKEKGDWSYQFNDLHPEQVNLKVRKDGGDIDGITAATITARAFCDALQRAYDTYKKEILEKGGNQ